MTTKTDLESKMGKTKSTMAASTTPWDVRTAKDESYKVNEEFGLPLDDAGRLEKGKFLAHLAYGLHRSGDSEQAHELYQEHKADILNYINHATFNPPFGADSLKEEFLEGFGLEHLFTTGKIIEVPAKGLPGNYRQQTCPLMMDGKELGTFTRITGPGYEDTFYEGRIPRNAQSNPGTEDQVYKLPVHYRCEDNASVNRG